VRDLKDSTRIVRTFGTYEIKKRLLPLAITCGLEHSCNMSLWTLVMEILKICSRILLCCENISKDFNFFSPFNENIQMVNNWITFVIYS
jgi:hypothetical protein